MKEEASSGPTSNLPVLIDNYKKLVSYKSNLFKLEALIELEQDQATKEEFVQMKSDLVQAIQYQADQIKHLQGSPDFLFSVDRLAKEHKDRLCKVYADSWVLAYLLEVDPEAQQAKVVELASGKVRSVDSVLVQVQPMPSQTFSQGSYVEAVSYDDGLFHPAQVEHVLEQSSALAIPNSSNQALHFAPQVLFQVKFQRSNALQTVPLPFLRESASQLNQKHHHPSFRPLAKAKFDNLEEFKVPDHLKVLPNDSEQQRQIKKKKLKNLKYQFKQARLEKDTNDKMATWKVFQTKTHPNGIAKTLSRRDKEPERARHNTQRQKHVYPHHHYEDN